jgi:hypothetical protein
MGYRTQAKYVFATLFPVTGRTSRMRAARRGSVTKTAWSQARAGLPCEAG